MSSWQLGGDTRVDLARISLEQLVPLFVAQWKRVEVSLRVVVVVPRLRIDASHRSHHFGAEQDVIERHDFQQQLDSRKMIHACVEENVVAHEVRKQRPLHVLREPSITSPVERYGSAAVGNDETESSEIRE